MSRRSLATLAALWLQAGPLAANGGALHVYIWSDYVAPGVVEAFERETGIDVVYDIYSGGEAVETMLLAGASGYDVVVIPSEFLPRLIAAGAIREIDPAARGRTGLDPRAMALLTAHDPGNRYATPYLWGVTGVAYDAAKIAQRLPEMPADPWRMLFDPAIVSRLVDCGVGMIDEPEDVLLATLSWLGRDPGTINQTDIDDAVAALATISPHVSVFDSAMTGALERGEICLALIWSGDALSSAATAAPGVDLVFAGPPDGGSVWFDAFVTPADGSMSAAANQFIDYMLRPEVIAANSNYTWMPNAVPASAPFIDPEVRADANALFGEKALDDLAIYRAWSIKEKKSALQSWRTIKLGSF